MRPLCALAAYAAGGAAAAAAATAASSSSHFSARFGDAASGGTLTVSVGSASALLLSVRFGGWGAAPLASPALDDGRALAPSAPVAWGDLAGLQTAFGALLVSTTGSGAWALYDAANNTLVASDGPPLQAPNAAGEGGVLLPVAGPGAHAGPDQVSNCLNNGDFGAPFYANGEGGYLAYPVTSWLYDPAAPHCNGVSFQGAPALIPALPSAVCGAFATGQRAVAPLPTQSYPAGLHVGSQGDCCGVCNRDPACVLAEFADAPQANATEANCFPRRSFSGLTGGAGAAGWAVSPPGAQPPAPPRAPGWWVLGGGAADVYLAPAPGPLDRLRALYQLTGAPGVLPRYAMGAMYTYWGYDRMEEVEGNMTRFRDGSFPIDSHIMDYDWWNGHEVYSDKLRDFDFTYDPIMFGPHSFVHPANSTIPNATTTGPVDLLQHFHDDLHIHFAGIRKPRTYSNIALSNASGWLLPPGFEVGAGPNNWNFTPGNGWEDWYVPRHEHFLRDGMDFGETQYWTYTWWNAAQSKVSAAVRPGKRFFTVNRAFQPGMQRWPASTWTGDDQDCSHEKVLGFAVAGQLYHECDMTSPTATVLVRQYQNAILSPVFRVHQMHGVPRFPFLWGTPAHADAFRAALNLRYKLIPHLYSLAHASHRTLAPLAAPASYFFSGEGPLDTTYVYGGTLLPSAVSVARPPAPVPGENATSVFLPPGALWFEFNTTLALAGGQTLEHADVPLDVYRFYVRGGSLLALQGASASTGGAPIQHTGQLGGQLELHVYSGGGDAAFTLYEDDGESLDYGAARATAFAWAQATATLSWSTTSGGYRGGPTDYVVLRALLFEANASAPVVREGMALGGNGSVVF